MAPARTPFPMDFVAEERPADASLGRRVEKRELNISLACLVRKGRRRRGGGVLFNERINE